MRRFGLRDDQWERIKHLLPGRDGSVGVTAADNRLFVEAVLYRYRTGMPWRDLPERFGDGTKVRIPMMPPGHTEVEASTCSNLMPSTVLR
jgi:transposase